MSKRLTPIALGLLALLVVVLALAWYDGGREDLREIRLEVPASGPVTEPAS